MPSPTLQTAEDLLRFREPGKTAELVRGVLIVREPPGTHHGRVSGRFDRRLADFVEQHNLGEVFPQDTGFKIEHDPDTVRAPDVAFVSTERLAQIPERGYAPLAPDLVVEVASPGDRPGEVLEKVGEWLNAGVRLVWYLDAARREGRVYRPDGSVTLLGPGDAFDGEDVLPGFSCQIADLV